MTDTEFNTAVDATLLALEDAIDALSVDIDIEMSAGILTLTFETGSKIIINRQAATQEIWVAARSGGFHCAHQEAQWFCKTTQETLAQLLNRTCSEHAGCTVELGL